MIYFDNASTTFPKPDVMPKAVYQYMTEIGCNINLGCYDLAYSTEEIVYNTRLNLCKLFHSDFCKNVVFTKNITESLNIILKGFLRPGDHVLVSSMEHNAIMRPLTQLKQQGVSFTRVPCALDGTLNPNDLESFLTPDTKAVIMTHASNVCGTLLPIQQIGEFCHKHHIKFILDSAQTAGVWDIDMKEMHIDALAFTGHKGLLGPQGIGGFILEEDMISRITPLLSGGTGSISHTEDIPDFMPDRFEPGTLNLPGIIGLHASLEFLEKTKPSTIRCHETQLTQYFLDCLKELDSKEQYYKIIGKKDTIGRTGVVSIQTPCMDLSQVAYQLDAKYQIMTRVGIHCAPSAHKTLGTYPTGTIRFSFGWWNTKEEIDIAIDALKLLTKESNHGI